MASVKESLTEMVEASVKSVNSSLEETTAATKARIAGLDQKMGDMLLQQKEF